MSVSLISSAQNYESNYKLVSQDPDFLNFKKAKKDLKTAAKAESQSISIEVLSQWAQANCESKVAKKLTEWTKKKALSTSIISSSSPSETFIKAANAFNSAYKAIQSNSTYITYSQARKDFKTACAQQSPAHLKQTLEAANLSLAAIKIDELTK